MQNFMGCEQFVVNGIQLNQKYKSTVYATIIKHTVIRGLTRVVCAYFMCLARTEFPKRNEHLVGFVHGCRRWVVMKYICSYCNVIECCYTPGYTYVLHNYAIIFTLWSVSSVSKNKHHQNFIKRNY